MLVEGYNKNRVNISKNKSEDISGGYILKIDKSTGDASNPKSQNEIQET